VKTKPKNPILGYERMGYRLYIESVQDWLSNHVEITKWSSIIIPENVPSCQVIAF
jgi:hypothetical protein